MFPAFGLCLALVAGLLLLRSAALQIGGPLLRVEYPLVGSVYPFHPFVLNRDIDIRIGNARTAHRIDLVLHCRIVVLEGGIHIENLRVIQIQQQLETVCLPFRKFQNTNLFLLLVLGPESLSPEKRKRGCGQKGNQNGTAHSLLCKFFLFLRFVPWDKPGTRVQNYK